jgi:hypothetical protein
VRLHAVQHPLAVVGMEEAREQVEVYRGLFAGEAQDLQEAVVPEDLAGPDVPVPDAVVGAL